MEGIAPRFRRRPVIAGASLEVAEGELACLLGPSAAARPPCCARRRIGTLQRGRVVIDGEVVASAADGRQVPPERRRVGLMFRITRCSPT